MSRNRRLSPAELARERTLSLYAAALARGDVDTLLALREEAVGDLALQQEIDRLEDQHEAQLPEVALAQDAALVQDLLRRHLPSAAGTPESAPEALTVGDVVARLLIDRRVAEADLPAAQGLRDSPAPLPARIGLRQVRRQFQALGVAVSERFVRLFRETALLLGLSHSQATGFVAARRQRSRDGGDGEQQ
jgi:hypothetical protein